MKNLIITISIICNIYLLYNSLNSKQEFKKIETELKTDLYAETLNRVMDTNYNIHTGEQFLKQIQEKRDTQEVIKDLTFFINYNKRTKQEMKQSLNIQKEMTLGELDTFIDEAMKKAKMDKTEVISKQ